MKNVLDFTNQLSLNNNLYKRQVISFVLDEIERDVFPSWDLTSNLFEDYPISAEVYVKDVGILAWIEEAVFVFKKFNVEVEVLKQDWDKVDKEKILVLRWNFKNIMKLERTVLNVLQRMSAIATKSRKFIDIIDSLNLWDKKPFICATRKTLYWMLDKKAVWIWWASTHRLNLSDAVLIKENHIKRNWIEKTLEIAWNSRPENLKFFEIECENEKEALITANFFKNNNLNQVQVIMLDNFKSNELKSIIEKIKNISSSIYIEVSWGVNENNIEEYANVWADFISMWCLTHSVLALDISLRVV